MSQLEWTIEKLAEKLDRSYLEKALKHMRFNSTTIQFGEMGEGIAPNYQTCFENGVKIPRHGISPMHKQFEKSESFCEKNLSDHFSYADIQQALKMCQKS